jgi:1-acyl-sn-glycerol-3-phosphate acyltransferase
VTPRGTRPAAALAERAALGEDRRVLRAFSVVSWAFSVAVMPPLFAIALAIWAVTLPFDRRRVVLHLFSCVWGSLYVWLNPLWRLRVEGREKLPWKGPAILVANHLSLLDILVVYDLFRPFKWVAKEELFRVPFVGWTLLINDYVPVKRGAHESVKRMMEHCRAHLDRGMPILMFPEGTRSKDGRLQAFKDGAFKLAVEAGCPVYPVVITGTFEALPKHGLVIRQKMRATVRVLDPLDPHAFQTPDALRAATRAVFAAELHEAPRAAARTTTA